MSEINGFKKEEPIPQPVKYIREFLSNEVIEALKTYLTVHGVEVPKGKITINGLTKLSHIDEPKEEYEPVKLIVEQLIDSVDKSDNGVSENASIKNDTTAKSSDEALLLGGIYKLAIYEYKTAENIKENPDICWQSLNNDLRKLYIDRALWFIGIWPQDYWSGFDELKTVDESDKFKGLYNKYKESITFLLLHTKLNNYETAKAKLLRQRWNLQPVKKRLPEIGDIVEVDSEIGICTGYNKGYCLVAQGAGGVRLDFISDEERHGPCKRKWRIRDDL